MNSKGQHATDPNPNDHDSLYTLLTENSSSLTESDRPGPGRNLGNFYSYLGSKLENFIPHNRHPSPQITPPRRHPVQDPGPNGNDNLNYTSQIPPRAQSPSGSESSYFLCSFNSSTETNSDVPGPGRLLGKAYGFFGKKVEKRLSVAAVKLGLGPRATAMTIRRLARKGTNIKLSGRKKLKSAEKRLMKYVR